MNHPTEVKRIEECKNYNDKLEEYFKERRIEWDKNITPLFEVLSIRHFSKSMFDKIINAQALGLSFRHQINDQISMFLNKRTKEEIKVKNLKHDKFLYYATGYGLKTNTGEKNILIDAHMAESERTLQIIDVHIDYLRDSVKTIESFQFSIKNIISLFDYIGK